MTHLPDHWIQKLQVALSIPGWLTGDFNHQVTRFFEAQAQAEGGTAQWNPLNTTDHVTDSWGPYQGTDYNKLTVANYNHPWQGIAATAATLLQSVPLQPLLADMRAGTHTAEDLVTRNEAAIRNGWGTDPHLMLEILAATP